MNSRLGKLIGSITDEPTDDVVHCLFFSLPLRPLVFCPRREEPPYLITGHVTFSRWEDDEELV
jgi:hypothetical protein